VNVCSMGGGGEVVRPSLLSTASAASLASFSPQLDIGSSVLTFTGKTIHLFSFA
jgi:hypothetical protein